MSDTRDLDDLERRLRTTFGTKAEQIVVDTSGFDLTDALVDVAPPRSRRRILAIATVMVVAAAATATLVVAARAHSRASIVATESSVPSSSVPVTAPPPSPNPIDAPLIAPTFMPDGQQLWSLTSRSGSGTGFPTQLFGTVAPDGTLAPGLLVELQPASPGDGLGSGTQVTVRGQSGVTRASKDAGDAPFEIDWIEAGAYVRVTVRGASVAQAVAALDALQARGSSLMTGFDPASVPTGYPLLGERLTSGPDVSATFEYSAAPPDSHATPDFTVVTDVAGSYPGYLRTWIAGHRAADGTTVELDPGVGYYVAWPDGRDVIVQSGAGNTDLTVLEQIVRSAKTLDASSAAALAAAAQARVASLPWFGSAPMTAGQISLYGTGSPTAVCLQLRGADIACSNPFASDASTSGSLPGYAGSAVIDGHWYVFVAASAEPSITENGGRNTELPAELAQIHGTHVALVAVPDNVDTVQIMVPTGPNQAAGTGFRRPQV
jgi:hypothetical protein